MKKFGLQRFGLFASREMSIFVYYKKRLRCLMMVMEKKKTDVGKPCDLYALIPFIQAIANMIQ